MQGQAVWKPTRNRPELTGELLMAMDVHGNYFVQMSKDPFPMVTAQVSGATWQIEFGANQRRWSGEGDPPRRFAWFQLPPAISGNSVERGWTFERADTGSWKLTNPRSGEFLEGEFFP